MDPGSKIYSPLKNQLSPIWMRQHNKFIISYNAHIIYCIPRRLHRTQMKTR